MAQTEATAHESDENIYRRIGQLTRTLHDALRELGYERELMDARDNLPGARDRLAYIARVTGEAAEKVLNAVDRARTVQQELTEQADSLRNRWQAVAAYAAGGRACTPAGKQLVDETCESGSTMKLALAAVRDLKPSAVKTAVSFKTGTYKPDFYALENANFIILPWDLEVIVDGEIVVRPDYRAKLKEIPPR